MLKTMWKMLKTENIVDNLKFRYYRLYNGNNHNGVECPLLLKKMRMVKILCISLSVKNRIFFKINVQV